MSTVSDTTQDELVVVDADAVSPIERRRDERLNIYLKVRWEGLLGRYEGTVSDISAGGCFIITESHSTLRELVRVEIELHTGEWIKVWGEVTNQFPGVGFGVRYTEFDEEDAGKFALSLDQTRSIKAGVGALRRVDKFFLGPEGEDVFSTAPDNRKKYKAQLMLALHKVNKTLLDLPECQKKTALRLSVHAYTDLYWVWAAMAEAAAGNPRELIEAYKCLKEKYCAPADIVGAVRSGNLSTVLNFLRQRAHIYLTFIS
jgi:hypothetical protein